MRLPERFEQMSAACAEGHVTLRRLLPGLGPRDHGLVTLLVGVCFLNPLPMPGISWGLGILVTVTGARMILGKGLWLPASLLDKSVPSRLPGKAFAAAGRAFKKTERWVKPRGIAVVALRATNALTGIAVVACGVMLLIPIPPPANYPPAAALLFLSMGILEGDLLFLVLGYGATAAGIALFWAIAYFGVSGLTRFLTRS